MMFKFTSNKKTITLELMLTLFLNILWITIIGGWIVILTLFEHGITVHLLVLLAAIIYVLKLMQEELTKSG
ncbi:hypothetical protein QRD02_07130 [Aequorivita sp. SDUM287046]|uniref:Lmo0937 family membrane protein n=1 Tax=Aequorivita aurantiaca TaxID=3053356 RepID=A0ABT8DJS2_9FLAO|nr:hypothetical protein [Aequorivita aurantiaca]MDN3724150.1 hypothetical protein [Aequorivita aurantiaca]